MEIKNQVLVPMVVEKSGQGERAYDIYSRLLKDRIIFIGTAIEDIVANLISLLLEFIFLTSIFMQFFFLPAIIACRYF